MTPASRADAATSRGRGRRRIRALSQSSAAPCAGRALRRQRRRRGVRRSGALRHLAGVDARRRAPRGTRGVAGPGVADGAAGRHRDDCRGAHRRVDGLAAHPHRPAAGADCGGSSPRCRSSFRRSSAPPRSSPGSVRTASCATPSSSSAITRRAGSAASAPPSLVLTLFTYPLVYLPVAARLAGVAAAAGGEQPAAR